MTISLGGVDNQTLAAAGIEGNLDVQFAFGISHPIPVRGFHSVDFSGASC